MTKVPPDSGNNCIKKVQKLGFVIVRQRGSHVVLGHPDGRMTVVPCHKGRDLGCGVLRKILKDAKVKPEEFNDL